MDPGGMAYRRGHGTVRTKDMNVFWICGRPLIEFVSRPVRGIVFKDDETEMVSGERTQMIKPGTEIRDIRSTVSHKSGDDDIALL